MRQNRRLLCLPAAALVVLTHVETYKETKTFVWNPKEYVPMERPYTMLYEEDFPPSDDVYIEEMVAASSERISKSNQSVSSSLLLVDDLGSPLQSGEGAGGIIS